MDEPRLEELLYRIETLEREKRRWKLIGIGSLCILLALVLVGGLFSIGTALLIQKQQVRAIRAEQEALMRAEEAAEQAHQAAMQEREVAERAREAAMQAEERARQAEKKVKDDGR
jgi:hypothetical protein